MFPITPQRTWQVIVRELASETDPELILQLTQELEAALETQKKAPTATEQTQTQEDDSSRTG